MIINHLKKYLNRYIILVILLIGLGYLGYQKLKYKQVLRIGLYSGSSWNVPNVQENTVISDVIKRFEKKYPNVVVEFESGITKGDYSDWLSDKIVQGKQPDVFVIPENDFTLLASTGSLLNLEHKVQDGFDSSVYYSASFDSGKYNGKQFALPFENNPVLMCINRDLLESQGIKIPDYGWTLEEFFRLCQQLTKDTDGDGVLDQFGIVGYTWQNAVAAHGISSILNSTGDVEINTTNMRQILNWYDDLTNLSGNYTVNSSDFDKGNVAFMPMTLAEYRTYKPYPYHVSKYSSFEWSCIKMPSKFGVQTSEVQNSLFGISSKTKQSKLAWEFLKLLSSDKKTQQDLFEQSQGASVLKSVVTSRESEKILQNDTFGVTALSVGTINQILNSAEASPRVKSYYNLLKQADYLINQSLENDSIDSNLGNIQEELEREFNK